MNNIKGMKIIFPLPWFKITESSYFFKFSVETCHGVFTKHVDKSGKIYAETLSELI
jgi:hypothetical protein